MQSIHSLRSTRSSSSLVTLARLPCVARIPHAYASVIRRYRRSRTTFAQASVAQLPCRDINGLVMYAALVQVQFQVQYKICMALL